MRDGEKGKLARFKRELKRSEQPPYLADPLYNLAMGWLREGPPQDAQDFNYAFCDGGLTSRNGHTGTFGTYGVCMMSHLPAFDTPDEWEIGVVDGGVLGPTVFAMGLDQVTSNQAEFAALIRALCWLPDGWKGRIVSDSAVTLRRFYSPFETSGLLEEHIHLLIMLAERVPDCKCIYNKGHQDKLLSHLAAGNCLADALADAAGEHYKSFCEELTAEVDDGLRQLVEEEKHGGTDAARAGQQPQRRTTVL